MVALPPDALAAVRAEVSRCVQHIKDHPPPETASSASSSAAATTPADHAFRTTLSDAIVTYIRAQTVYTLAMVRAYEHKFEHTNSCFKRGLVPGARVIFCRYDFCMPCCCTTTLGAQGDAVDKIELRRQIGSNYINACPPLLFALTRSNCNLTLLRGKNVSYCTKYTAKPQDKIDSVAVAKAYTEGVRRSFRRREAREAELTGIMTDKQKGEGKLYSLSYWYSYMDEMPSTMGAWYVLNQRPPIFQSHPTALLLLHSAVSAHEGSTQVRHRRLHPLLLTLPLHNPGTAHSSHLHPAFIIPGYTSASLS
jgi:hypothetical protein